MTHRARILLVDDEVAIQRAVGPLLRARGYEVDVAGTGTDALQAFTDRHPDLIVLDLGLPDLEGTEVCRRVRAQSDVPIVVLSARGSEADKVNALDLGADDYVTKPFGPEELLARIRVALRRVVSGEDQEKGHLRAGDLTIDYDRRRVLRGATEIRLTPKEFELLSLLARNHDRVLTHRAILKEIWGPKAMEQPEHLWTLVAQLRKKVEPDPANPRTPQRAVGGLQVCERESLTACLRRRLSSSRDLVLRECCFERRELVVGRGGHHTLSAQVKASDRTSLLRRDRLRISRGFPRPVKAHRCRQRRPALAPSSRFNSSSAC